MTVVPFAYKKEYHPIHFTNNRRIRCYLYSTDIHPNHFSSRNSSFVRATRQIG